MRLRTLRYAIVLFAVAAAAPRSAAAQIEAVGSVGALGLRALTLEYDDREDSGNFFGLGATLLLNQRWVGVAQAEFLQTGSLSEAGANTINNAFGLMGGLGVRFGIPGIERLSVDLLGYGGYAQLNYTASGSDFTDASPQFGIGLTPRYELSDRLAITLAFRTLAGADVGEGTAINRTDIGIGGWLRVF